MTNPITYIAVNVTVMRPSGERENYVLSMNNKMTDKVIARHENLKAYASGSLHIITAIQDAQSFLVHSGYGLSNVILLDVSELYETSI